MTILTLKNKKIETNLCSTLIFERPQDFNFNTGQYLSVSIVGLMTHGKSYTISSTPKDEYIALTIKRQGKFSSALLDLSVGETIQADVPQGYFFDKFSSDKKNVFIAGGIGITPFMSLLRSYNQEKVDYNQIELLYSNKYANEIVFFDELKTMAEKDKIKLINFLTQEKNDQFEFGRISAEVIKKQVNNLSEKSFYLCGSISFVNDMWLALGSLGVTEEQIFTEAFF